MALFVNGTVVALQRAFPGGYAQTTVTNPLCQTHGDLYPVNSIGQVMLYVFVLGAFMGFIFYAGGKFPVANDLYATLYKSAKKYIPYDPSGTGSFEEYANRAGPLSLGAADASDVSIIPQLYFPEQSLTALILR